MEYDPDVLRNLQLVELDILVEIDRVCCELGISYFLDSGTLLGAVRHGGFIPWDDDIDIGMLRADYDRFLAEAEAVISSEYEICSPGKADGYAPMFSKVMKKGTVFETPETQESGFKQGIFVDVFPYDFVSSDSSVSGKQKRRCRVLQTISYLYHAGNVNPLHSGFLGGVERRAFKVAHSVLNAILDEQKIAGRFDYWARIGNSGSEGDSVMAYAYPVADGIKTSDVLSVAPIEFEGVVLSGPSRPEKVLEFYYGKSWVDLPPEEDRKNHAPLRLEF